MISEAARESRRFAIADLAADEGFHLLKEIRTAREQEWDSPVENQALRRETAIALAHAKQKLTRLQRRAVEGLVEERRPRAEVAHELEIKAGTLSAHRHRALLKLYAELIGFVGIIGGVIAILVGILGLLSAISIGQPIEALALPYSFGDKQLNRPVRWRRKQLSRAWVQATGRDLSSEELTTRIYQKLAATVIPAVAAGAFSIASKICVTIAVGMDTVGLTSAGIGMDRLRGRCARTSDRLYDRVYNRLTSAFPPIDHSNGS